MRGHFREMRSVWMAISSSSSLSSEAEGDGWGRERVGFLELVVLVVVVDVVDGWWWDGGCEWG